MISDVATELNQDAADPGRIVTPCPISDPQTPLSAALPGQSCSEKHSNSIPFDWTTAVLSC